MRAFIEEGWLDKVKVVKINSADKVSYESLAVAPRLGDEGKVRLERAWKTCVENELIPLKAKLAKRRGDWWITGTPVLAQPRAAVLRHPKPIRRSSRAFAAKLQMVIAVPVFGQVIALTTFGPQFI